MVGAVHVDTIRLARSRLAVAEPLEFVRGHVRSYGYQVGFP